MAGISVSHMILFIASLMVASAVAGVLIAGVDQVSNSVADRSADVSEDIKTDIEIITQPSAGDETEVYDGSSVKVLVMNTGTEPLPADAGATVITINGQLVSESDIDISRADGSAEGYWARNDVVEVVITDSGYVDSGDNQLQITVNGDHEQIHFRG